MSLFYQTNRWRLPKRAACLFTFVMTLSLHARAQDVEPQKAADAQALFEQAMVDMEAKQYANACKKFEEVTRLVPEGVGGKYMLGECYERQGKLASAWAQFSFAFQLATRFGQTERANDAQARVEALKPKLATLCVTVSDELRSVPEISVIRDGIDLHDAQWGTPLYVDAGPHDVIVTAPGYTTWKKRVEVLTDNVEVKLVVPKDAIRHEIMTPPKEKHPIAPVVVTPPPPDYSWRKPAGIAGYLIGSVMLSTGFILGGLAVAKKNESNESGHCTLATNRCDDTGLTMRKDAVGLGNASTGLIVAGAVVGVVGVVLWVTAPKRPPTDEKTGLEKQLMLELGPGRVDLRVHF